MNINVTKRLLHQNLERPIHDDWPHRGLRLVFVFGLVSLLAAIVTFTAHNLTYLSTVGKLFGLGVILLVAVGFWLRLGLGKSIGAVMAGVAAQVLIGVWLAAAGQLYQAPGGLQDLLIIWAVLGLPFVLASKHAAHWAVWLALIVGISVTPAGQYLTPWFSGGALEVRALFWGSLFSLIAFAALRLKAPIWLVTAAAFVGAGFLFGALQLAIWDSRAVGTLVATSVIVAGAAVWLFMRRQALAALCLYTVVALSVPVAIILKFVTEGTGEFFAVMLLFAVVFGGATFVLIRLFSYFRRHYAVGAQAVASPQGDEISLKGADKKTLWYMDVLIALGGVLTAIFATIFIGSFLAFIAVAAGLEEKIMMAVGLVLYVLFFMLRLKAGGPYRQYLYGTLLLIGQITAMAGFALQYRAATEIWGLLSICLAVPVLWLIPQRIMEVIQSMIIALSVFVIFSDYFLLFGQAPLLWIGPFLFLVFAGLAGICFFIDPQQEGRWFKAATVIFLLAAIWAELFNPEFLRETVGLAQAGAESASVMILRAVSFALAVAGFAWAGLRAYLPPWPILAAMTVIVALLPGGAAGAALLLLVGYAGKLKSYFHLGSVAALYFLFAAYYDLRLTLLELSAVLAISGVIFLGIWHVSRRKLSQPLAAEAQL